MRNIIILLCLIIFLGFPVGDCRAGSFEHKGQISVWGSYSDDSKGKMGGRYIPEVSFSQSLSGETILDAELSANLYTFTSFDSSRDIEDNARAKLYRSWLRLFSPRYEARLGLQRINFGSAKILRSLRWFDQLDVRDPLQLTEGVYALLGRYYFLNNANIWGWGLYDNDDLKGLEAYKTDEDRPEFGGRFQFPVSKGEMAFTYHHRYLDKEWWRSQKGSLLSEGIENRYAVDGSFDAGIGFWFEAVAGDIKVEPHKSLWTEFLTVGADYTFDIGSGLHVLGEHFIKTTGTKIFNQDETVMTSALSVDFSINVLDTVTIIGYYDWDKGKIYPNASWQRTYDNWLINLIAFSNSSSADNAYSGVGALCTVAYNY